MFSVGQVCVHYTLYVHKRNKNENTPPLPIKAKLTRCYLQEEFLSVVSRLGLEVVRWETTQRCSTHYFTLLRRKQSAVDTRKIDSHSV